MVTGESGTLLGHDHTCTGKVGQYINRGYIMPFTVLNHYTVYMYVFKVTRESGTLLGNYGESGTVNK